MRDGEKVKGKRVGIYHHTTDLLIDTYRVRVPHLPNQNRCCIYSILEVGLYSNQQEQELDHEQRGRVAKAGKASVCLCPLRWCGQREKRASEQAKERDKAELI